jgi:hypothetical protein
MNEELEEEIAESLKKIARSNTTIATCLTVFIIPFVIGVFIFCFLALLA